LTNPLIGDTGIRIAAPALMLSRWASASVADRVTVDVRKNDKSDRPCRWRGLKSRNTSRSFARSDRLSAAQISRLRAIETRV
jgi:hypothetical protein